MDSGHKWCHYSNLTFPQIKDNNILLIISDLSNIICVEINIKNIYNINTCHERGANSLIIQLDA